MKHFNITETELWAYVSKTAEDATIQKVEQWMDSSDFDESLFAKMTTIYKQSSQQDTAVKEAKSKFFKSVQTQKPKVFKNVLKYAAVVIVFISCAYFYQSIQSKTNQIVVQTTFGEQTNIHLPDGSTVWLNGASKLTYESDTPRKLYLEGEGFFEVAKDSLHPFTVTTSDHITVKALGTSFNVKSYLASKSTETKLLTGKVEVSSTIHFDNKVLLYPNDKVSFDKHSKKIVKSIMKPKESIIGWKTGKIQFNNKTFKEIAIVLKAQFGQQIRFKNNQIAATKFTGSFDNTTPIDEIFEILKISRDFNYQLNTVNNEWIIK